MKYEIVKHDGKNYAVFDVKFKNYNLPIVLDYDDFKVVKGIGKNWRCNKYGAVCCSHTINGITKDVYLHDVIMNIKYGDKTLKKPILHLNRLGLDNRRNNLAYDTAYKDKKKNLKKKKRTIKLPASYGIDPNDIPTYVWYMKENGSHGERFMVSIGDVQWKTTSSRNVDLETKLDSAKSFLRKMQNTRPDLFESYSMNGDFTREGKELNKSYYDIIHKAGYDHIKRDKLENYTSELLDAWSDSEESYYSD